MQREDRKRKGESEAHWDHAKRALPPKVAGRRESERVKTLTGDWIRNLFFKTIDRKKVSIYQDSINSGAQSEVLELNSWWCSAEEMG